MNIHNNQKLKTAQKGLSTSECLNNCGNLPVKEEPIQTSKDSCENGKKRCKELTQ